MIQAIGLTSIPRKEQPPAVDNVSFEAHAGRVTALLGAPGAGKTTVLRLMLELQRGRGITYFRGRPLHRIPHPAHEVGVVLGDVPGHPARSVRGHLRMLCAASGVPARRADEVLEAVGLVSLRDERLGSLSRGMDRRLGLACALLPDPHTLVLDDPARGLAAGERHWLHDMLREHAAQGGTVLCSTADPKEAARFADHVVTLDGGRLVADQRAADFARTRLRPRVVVRSPHAARLSVLLAQQARTAQRSVEVVREGGNRLCVYGSTCAEVGETAFRNGIVVHQLADEVGDMGPGAGTDAEGSPTPAAESRPAAVTDAQSVPDPDPEAVAASDPGPESPTPEPEAAPAPTTPPEPPHLAPDDDTPQAAPPPQPATPSPASVTLPPPVLVRPAPTPLRPVRYEIRRAAGVATGYIVGACVLAVSALTAVLLARIGHTPQPRLLAAWPVELPLPPAALGAGLLGALAFGDEFRHPALAVDRGTVPRRLGLLTAKLFVASLTALALAVLTVGCTAELLYLVYGSELVALPADWPALTAGWLTLVTGCAWAGVLAAGVFRSTTAGLAAVVAVPLLVVPAVHTITEGPAVRGPAPLAGRLRDGLPLRWPFGGEQHLEALLRLLAQPVGGAMALSVLALLCAYAFTGLRSRVR
ncbi:ABC transporter ATP-binding protein [Streptomyces cellulosae]|uniref:ABC transporter ATP-binding protein n=2 Tax=Streptomyces TaxID=1883 RepID=A0ABU3IZT1_9ACTN|nr:ABC-type multidrug transport system ATPase subunit [Streptomyces thermodiastaticus]MDT6968306.1 ABC transporter ATP-binding protein [Streptomyces thermocarboxydus]WSB43951.1 ABC transporter ATP-binding protein [Streptomyces cellulosae]UVT12175.1 ABC transporter ATP-binding protein [Streptomyces thermocarboxydus]WSB56795.1 ABC transporter ATP-binding protein [Streptomyces cellulosae]